MSPTVPTNANVDQQTRTSLAKPHTAERRSELVCRVKYCNTLPDIPFDPKFIQYPFESTRFIQYKPTSLERNYKYEVLTEHDLGVTIDLINKDMYSADPDAVLDPADEKLLEEDILTPHDSKRSRHHSRSVSWLRRTEYISTEQTRFQPQVMDKVEAKVGFSIKKSLKDETVYMDRESQIKAIEKTFVDALQPPEKHHSKPNVVPVEILPLYPDFMMWKYPCAQVMFDSDPAPVGQSFPAQMEQMSQAMIRGVMDESGEQFVAYFLPTDVTMEKRRRDFMNGIDYEDDDEYDYKIAREYNWNVKTKASKGYEENYFFVVRPDGVYYNELETRVRLSKRRQKVGSAPNNTRLVVRHRPMDAAEFNIHRQREKQLTHPIDEEDEDEEEDITKEQSDKEDAKSGSEKSRGGDSDAESSASDREDVTKEESDKEDAKSESEKSRGGDSDAESGASDREDITKEQSDKEDVRSGSEKSQGGDSDAESGASDREDVTKEESDKEDAKSESEKSRGGDSDAESAASDREDATKEESDKEDAKSESEKSRGGDSDAESGASDRGGKSASRSSGSVSSRSGSDEE